MTSGKSDMSFNPFFMRFPLFSPDRLLTLALPGAAWLLTWPFLVVWCCCVLVGFILLFNRWGEFANSAAIYLSPQNWIWLWTIWLLLKLIHEFFHGLVCKKFGGYVGQCGLALFLFSPVAYVDVTSTWHFRSKWQRIATSAAGMYIEIFIAAVAAIVWNASDNPTIQSFCHSTVTAAGISTILFNANPLMRFDGYYILSDWLGISNLYGQGQQYVQSLVRWIYLGQRAGITANRDLVASVRVYGVLSFGWRWLICASLLIGASTLFHGAGLLITLFGLATWFGKPLLKYAKSYIGAEKLPTAQRCQLALTTMATILLAVAAALMPRPGGITAPAVVAFADSEIVRNEVAGFVEAVEVSAGQWVTPGQLLLRIRSDELGVELARVRFAVAEARLMARAYHQDNELAQYQAEIKTLEALRGRYEQLKSKNESLLVRSPIAGKVIVRNLDELLGQHIDIGTSLMTIANEEHKEIHLSVSEEHIDAFTRAVGTATSVNLSGCAGAFQGCPLVKVEPRASLSLRQPALGAQFGGPIPVMPISMDQALTDETDARYKLIQPRFHGVVALPTEMAQSFAAGQIAKVRLHTENESVGRWIRRKVAHWVDGKLKASLGQP